MVCIEHAVGVLFRSRRTAQRRFAALRDVGLITRHQVGLTLNAVANGPVHYRLTSAGVRAVVAEFPEESHLEHRQASAVRLSLRNHEHHDGIVDLYTRLVAGGDPEESIARTVPLRYWHDGDVQIEVASPGLTGCFVPDAVFQRNQKRIFVELDRSTKDLGRIARTLRRYAAYAAGAAVEDPFKEKLPPRLLFVTRSWQRANHIARKAEYLDLGTLEQCSLPLSNAVSWLRNQLFDDPIEESADAAPPPQSDLLARVHQEGCQLIQLVRAAGQRLPPLPAISEAGSVLKQAEHGGA